MKQEVASLEEEFKKISKCLQTQEKIASAMEDAVINISKILGDIKDKLDGDNE